MDRFVFPRSFYESIKTFKSAQREALYTSIFGFIFDDTEPELKSVELQRMWMLIFPILSKAKKISNTISSKPQDNLKTISRDTKEKVERKSEQSQENVKTISRQTPFKEKEKEKDKENKEKDKEKGSASASPAFRFIKPTVEQVSEYVKEKGYHFDPLSFHAFYESKGWKVGNSPMKSWQAACVTWEKRCPHEEEKPVVKKKEIPVVKECPVCGSTDLRHGLGAYKCNSCNLMWEWNYETEQWETTI